MWLPGGTRASVLTLLAAALSSCGASGPSRTADAVVKAWLTAVNDGDWKRACDLTARAEAECERQLRDDFADAELGFEGPATGGDPAPGEEYFAISTGARDTVFVMAVPEDDSFAVRVEAIVERFK